MTQKPRNADYTREYNRKAVLRILRRQAMSRAELARATGGGFFDRGGASERRRCDGTCPPVRRTGAQCHTVGSAPGQLLRPRGGLGQKGLHGGTVRYRRQPAAMPGAAGARRHGSRHYWGACSPAGNRGQKQGSGNRHQRPGAAGQRKRAHPQSAPV